MIELIFTGQDKKGEEQEVYMKLDRTTKYLEVKSNKTGGKFKHLPWIMLFDQGKEKIQESVTDKMNNEEFIKEIVTAMTKKAGYTIKKIIR